MAGEFAKLLDFKWRGASYPLTRIHLSLAHDLVEHKYWGVDGARVEDTGVSPIRIEAVIPIGNSIFPGSLEGWAAGKLYPTALRAFLTDFAKRSTGLVQHPEFGGLPCKAERMDFEYTGERQDATEIRASWIVTVDDDVAVQPASPVQDLQSAAADLTASGVDLRDLVPELPEFTEDIESLGRKLSSLTDQVSILSYRTAGTVGRILYQVNRMQQSIERAGTPLTWPAMQSIQRIKSASYALLRKSLSMHGIGLYTVPGDTTLAGVSVALPSGTAMGDVITMNPNLMRSPVVQKGSVVRYPLAA